MLSSLRIENFALIERANIQFSGGFTVITGETGSGKSILLSALNLLLGERANLGVIADNKEKAIVEAEFDLSLAGLNDYFEANDLDYDSLCIVRREISKQGKSRAFINDTPVQLTVLKEISSKLLHVHSQFNTLELKETDFQFDVLDILAGVRQMREEYVNDFYAYTAKANELKRLRNQLTALSAASDYASFQLGELDELRLDQVNYESLTQELRAVDHAAELISVFNFADQVFNGERGVIEQLGILRSQLEKQKNNHLSANEISVRLNELLVELKDLAASSTSAVSQLSLDPLQADEIRKKLDEYNRILFKHRKTSQHELIELQSELRQSFENTDHLEQKINALHKELEGLDKSLNQRADRLHQQRMKAVPNVESQISGSLASLKLKDTIISFRLEPAESLDKHGKTKLALYFSPNQGHEPVLIHQAASGGELSRLMLTIQKLIASEVNLRTILFDEIDTGVSGEVAQKIGESLKEMGEHLQVIAVTHLPQVAALGAQHFKVVKQNENGRVQTRVLELDQAQRIEEIAALMSGEKITQSALETAKSLMK